MDHRRIDEQNVAELYVTGRLSPEDEETFECHLLECAECRERVGWADDLRASIRAVAAEEVARASAQLGFLAWISRRTRSARAGMLMAALLAVAALPAWLQADRSRLARELEEARAEATRPAPPALAPVASETPAPAPVADPELERLAQANSRLEAELKELSAQVDRLSEPQSTRIVSLGVLRGESDGQEIELGPSPEPIVVQLEAPQAAHYETYRVTLLAGKQEAWRKSGLVPDGNELVHILVDSRSLKPGVSYRFRLEGIEESGKAVDLGTIPFQAVKG